MVMMCSIPLCKSVASKHNVKLHKFPASEELLRIWIDRIRLYYPNFKISKSSLVCSKHFAEIDFFKTNRSTSFSLRKNAVPSLFDVDECVYVFNDGELDGDLDITSQSVVDVIETSIGVTTPIKMINNSNISEPSNTDVMETSILDIEVPETPKRMTNTSYKPVERKWVFGDFKADDLNTPRKRKRYWDISQQTVSKYKRKTKLLQNKNTWLTKKVKNLCQLIDHLKEENKISENCFSHLKESLSTAQREMLLKQLNHQTEKKISPELRAFALTQHFYSAAAYKYVRQVFNKCLPYPSTLRKWYAVVDGAPGFTKESINAIQIKVAEMKLKDKTSVCGMMIDEISIKEGTHFNGTRNQGYIRYGTDLNADTDTIPLAKEALVIMLVALNSNWLFSAKWVIWIRKS